MDRIPRHGHPAAYRMLDLDDHFELWNPPPEFIDKSKLSGFPRHGIGELQAEPCQERRRGAVLARADSLTLDPHKWLYTPVDCGALLWHPPATAAARTNTLV